MKLFLARIKKWNPVRVGVFVGLGLWAWDFFQRLNHNENFLPFYSRPFVWLLQTFLPLIKTPGQSPAHPVIFILTLFLSALIYYSILGALLGLVFQSLLWMFRRLKRHDIVHQIKARLNPRPP